MNLTAEQLQALARMKRGEWTPKENIPEADFLEKCALVQTSGAKATLLRKGEIMVSYTQNPLYEKYKDIEPDKTAWEQKQAGFKEWTFDALVLYKGFWRAVFTADSYLAGGVANMEVQPPLVRDYLEKFADGFHFKVITRNRAYEFLTSLDGKIIRREQHFREWQAENYDPNMDVRARKTIIRVDQKKEYDEYNS